MEELYHIKSKISKPSNDFLNTDLCRLLFFVFNCKFHPSIVLPVLGLVLLSVVPLQTSADHSVLLCTCNLERELMEKM